MHFEKKPFSETIWIWVSFGIQIGVGPTIFEHTFKYNVFNLMGRSTPIELRL